jgi:hypothetical protein
MMYTDRPISNSNTVKPAYSRILVSVAGRFRFKQALEGWILGTSDHRGCKSFPLKTGLHYTQILRQVSLYMLQLLVNPTIRSENTILNAVIPRATYCVCNNWTRPPRMQFPSTFRTDRKQYLVLFWNKICRKFGLWLKKDRVQASNGYLNGSR